MPDTPPPDTYRRVAARFTEVVEGAQAASAWDRPSPVPEWTARDVVRHLVEWFPPFLSSGTGIDLPGGPSPDDDPVGAWAALDQAVQGLLDDPSSSDRALSNPHIGEVPLPQAIDRFFTGDVFMHTWDLARATGQDDTLDPDFCAKLYTGMLPLDEVLRASGQFGPRVEVSDDADIQSQLIAFIGRDPAWRS